MASFADFLATFDPDAGKRGRQFEHFVKWFLKNDPEWATQDFPIPANSHLFGAGHEKSRRQDRQQHPAPVRCLPSRICISMIWNVAARRNPSRVPTTNPFAHMGLKSANRETPTATFAELQAFRAKAVEMVSPLWDEGTMIIGVCINELARGLELAR
jgi:hypothetical protein